MNIRQFVPYVAYKRIWGDRKKFGLQPDKSDPDWKVWSEKAFTDFYPNTQQQGAGDAVCNMGYPVIGRIDFTGKKILEVGPGIIRHLQYINNKPAGYTICDVSEDVLRISEQQLNNAKIPCEAVLLSRESTGKLPFADETFDTVISFNSLEHLHPLDNYLIEIKRTLKRCGQLVGGIPCEGGLAWGIGRYVTTRRYVHKNYGINYDKIICWQHPNFADFIIESLDKYFKRKHFKLHPLSWMPIDFNLVASFIYEKRTWDKT